jgi:hypothetical protein
LWQNAVTERRFPPALAAPAVPQFYQGSGKLPKTKAANNDTANANAMPIAM